MPRHRERGRGANNPCPPSSSSYTRHCPFLRTPWGIGIYGRARWHIRCMADRVQKMCFGDFSARSVMKTCESEIYLKSYSNRKRATFQNMSSVRHAFKTSYPCVPLDLLRRPVFAMPSRRNTRAHLRVSWCLSAWFAHPFMSTSTPSAPTRLCLPAPAPTFKLAGRFLFKSIRGVPLYFCLQPVSQRSCIVGTAPAGMKLSKQGDTPKSAPGRSLLGKLSRESGAASSGVQRSFLVMFKHSLYVASWLIQCLFGPYFKPLSRPWLAVWYSGIILETPRPRPTSWQRSGQLNDQMH